MVLECNFLWHKSILQQKQMKFHTYMFSQKCPSMFANFKSFCRISNNLIQDFRAFLIAAFRCMDLTPWNLCCLCLCTKVEKKIQLKMNSNLNFHSFDFIWFLHPPNCVECDLIFVRPGILDFLEFENQMDTNAYHNYNGSQ